MMLVLCTNNSIGARLLRFVMWSKYSHAAILDGNVVTDATFWQGGVKSHSAQDFFAHYTTYELREIDVHEAAAREWLIEQLGKKYDWTALLSWVVRRNWQEEDSWFCSELCEAMISLFGKPRFRECVSRISPRHQEMLA
jgi:uncharacterized protein YycO